MNPNVRQVLIPAAVCAALSISLFACCPAAADLIVADLQGDRVTRHDETTGTLIDVLIESSDGLDAPTALTVGPDGNLYVSSGASNQILRYDTTSNAFLGVFASGGGLDAPEGLAFGADGNLYVASLNSGNIKRFDGTTGAYIDDFTTGNLSVPEGVVFGADGNLYVADNLLDQVQRFDGTTGAFIDTFVSGLDGNDVVFATIVPEPTTVWLLLLGVGAAVRRRI
jgi:DNA-binding beta-propeller fold protein YncE